MDVCTSLVQAYLHINGYFTATDYPLVESMRDGAARAVTDIDMLAVRFGRRDGQQDDKKRGAGLGKVKGPVAIHTDPVLGCAEDRTDMIVAELKQGRAQINPAARNRQVLAAALARFGCCSVAEAPSLVQTLLQDGRGQGECHHSVRMVLFASRGERAPRGWHWVHLDHIFGFLDNYLRTERADLETVDLHDPALSWLSLLHKCKLTLQSEGPAP